MFSTPVLLIVFNRPNATKRVFEQIKKMSPEKLYIASDGPRESVVKESQKVEEIRNYIIANIDWNCDVKFLFRDKNLGCKNAVSSAITWFFDHEEKGIILEDDCLPTESFFKFSEELLIKYKDDRRIWHISGNNFQNGLFYGDASYYYSKFCHIWGWATWSDRWREYDVAMGSYNLFKKKNGLSDLFFEVRQKLYWENSFESVIKGKIDTWDYQWVYTIWANSGLCIVPNKNLVTNIGFDSDATHTKDDGSIYSRIPAIDIDFPLVHPSIFISEFNADNCTAKRMFTHRSLFERSYFIIRKLITQK